MPSQAYALAPAGFGAYAIPGFAEVATASGGASAAAAVGAVDIFAALGLVTVGASISYFAIDYLVGDHYDVIRVPLTEASPVPSPLAPASADSVPAYTYTATRGSAFGSGPTPVDAVNNLISKYPSLYCFVSASETSFTVGQKSASCDPAYNLTQPMTKVQTGIICPAGYSDSGGVCVLYDARAVSPDKACDLQRSGSALSMISDPDCAGSGTAIAEICNSPGISCTGTELQFTSTNAQGQPRQVVVTPSIDGGSVISTHQQRVSSGSTVVDSTQVQVSPSGVVQTISGGTTIGNVQLDGSPPQVGQAVLPTDFTFPSDYARTGEAQDAINSISPNVRQISDSLTLSQTVPDPADPTSTPLPNFGNTFDGLTGWNLPAHSSSCPTPSVDLSSVLGVGSVYTMTAHCDLINDHFGIFQSSALVVWSIMALFIVLRA